MRFALVASFAACTLAALVPQAAVAQAAAAPDSLPFRAGQWAAEFAVSSGMPAVGVLRFRSPSSAWLLNGQLDAATQSNDSNEQRVTSTYAAIQVGVRAYRPMTTRVMRHHGAGVVLSYQRQRSESEQESPYLSRATTIGPGAYGELGASVAVTPYLRLGAATLLELRYLWGSHERTVFSGSTEESDASQLNARLGGVRLVGTLLF